MYFEEAIALFKIGRHYENASLSNAQMLPKKLIDFAHLWLKNPSENLYLYGGVGSGKTYFTVCLLRELIKQNRNCLFINSLQLDRELLAALRDDTEYSEMHLINKYSECNFLFIDDLGVESDSLRVQRQYYEIINNRINHEKRMIINSNFSFNEIRKKLGDRIGSRLSGSFVVKFPNRDIRRQVLA